MTTAGGPDARTFARILRRDFDQSSGAASPVDQLADRNAYLMQVVLYILASSI